MEAVFERKDIPEDACPRRSFEGLQAGILGRQGYVGNACHY